ncbi:glycosyltransferase family 39 protein [Flavobacteriales bacterium]|nr:glycosyltransferase family 39 protein [Flavobacteriales bacterium]MDC0015125.1 glycosyltransferase family 39 protein [Flavobacteriales bacterium]
MNNNLLIINNNRFFWGIILFFTLIYFKGLFIIIYGIDASIYASISAEMYESGSYLQIFSKGQDYLDKPPLHFWLSCFSFKLFGINTFAYKLPSFLFSIVGAISTYKLGKLFYSKEVGKLSALLFYTTFAIILINQDVRTDTVLIGITIFTLWKLIDYIKNNNYTSFVLGFVGIGLAMMSKGPIGLMVPALALGTHFIIKKEWKNIFKWQWILGLIISFVVMLPMILGLYYQFDAQPDKITKLSSGMRVEGISGLKFFFWDQSFGRITGGNTEWKNNTGYLFFTHTFLWSFLPWSIMGVMGLIQKIKSSFSSSIKSEYYLLGAILLPLITFSLSQYKLPHYIYVFFPMWIILTGVFLINIKEKSAWYKVLLVFQNIINVALTLLPIFIITFLFPTSSFLIWIPVIVLIGVQIYTYIKTKGLNRMLLTNLLAFATTMFVLNFQFLPQVLKYDGFNNAAEYTKTLEINKLYSNSAGALIFDIYSNKTMEYLDGYNLDSLTNQNNYVFLNEAGYKIIKKKYDIKSTKEFKHNSATRLTIDFLNPKTRQATLNKTSSFYLIEI